jgi:hypothetical protein
VRFVSFVVNFFPACASEPANAKWIYAIDFHSARHFRYPSDFSFNSRFSSQPVRSGHDCSSTPLLDHPNPPLEFDRHMPGPKAAYVGFMDHERNLPQSPPQAWIDGLAEGEADVLAGRVSPWPEARHRLHALLASLRAGSTTTVR